MPYIKQEERDLVDPHLNKFLRQIGHMSPGEFVYIMYQIAQWQASSGGVANLPVGWTEASRVIADMECAKLEFYRRIIAPYEKVKINENGDCESPRANSRCYTRHHQGVANEVYNPLETDGCFKGWYGLPDDEEDF